MKAILFALLLLVTAFACTQQSNFPEKKSQRITDLASNTKHDDTNIVAPETAQNAMFKDLHKMAQSFYNESVDFNLNSFTLQWQKTKSDVKTNELKSIDALKWAEITGLLLELTADAKYAEELELLDKTGNKNLKDAAQAFALSKSVDHIYVNLFKPASVNYQHSLGGEVSFEQETDYPLSGSVKLHFGMTERRYMELYIRIPTWAEGATVTVKQVRYFAQPGQYCKIAKKWKEGDLVEIELPIHLKPKSLTAHNSY